MPRGVSVGARVLMAIWMPLTLVGAQSGRGAGRTAPEAPPSRAESLLARGRLAAAEKELYAAVDAAPRAPAARGELARYLASRARFTIAEVLFAEALRFGADTASIAQALMTIAPWHAEVDRRRIPGVRLPAAEAAREGARLAARAATNDASQGTSRNRLPPTAGTTADAAATAGGDSPAEMDTATVVFSFANDDRVLGRFELRGRNGTVRATLDPRVNGLLLHSADDAALVPTRFGASGRGAPLLVRELWIGTRRLRGVEARVDPDVPAGEVRLGLDVLWALHPVFDEPRGTMMLPAGSAPGRAPNGARQIPFARSFPGVWHVPAPGLVPSPIESARGRALLAGSKWRFDPEQATVIVER